MGAFRKASRAEADQDRIYTVRYSAGRPGWMRNGLELGLLDGGREDLEVVGESQYQKELMRLTSERRRTEDRVRKDIYALLVPEEGNPFDPNAISIWINGLQVGYLSREDAKRYRPGLLALQEKHGQPIALPGVIAAGGMDDDYPRRLGVFLRHDPEDFGLPRPSFPARAEARIRAGPSNSAASEEADNSWMRDLSTDDASAIPALRKLLASETHALRRHFIFAELEATLYRFREAFASALDEYDMACRQHDAEMGRIRAACMAKWGRVPDLELYRQMAIRQQKANEYGRALWWAERGLGVYGRDAEHSEAVDDLHRRAATYRAQLSRHAGRA